MNQFGDQRIKNIRRWIFMFLRARNMINMKYLTIRRNSAKRESNNANFQFAIFSSFFFIKILSSQSLVRHLTKSFLLSNFCPSILSETIYSHISVFLTKQYINCFLLTLNISLFLHELINKEYLFNIL